MLHEEIKNNIKKAMLAKDIVRLEVMRGILASFTNELISKKNKPTETLSDDEALKVIIRLAKQRRDSIEQFKKGGREDLVKEENEQLKILSEYLPEMMSEEEVERIVQMQIESLGIKEKKDKGRLMGTLMKELGGKADGEVINKVVDSLLV